MTNNEHSFALIFALISTASAAFEVWALTVWSTLVVIIYCADKIIECLREMKQAEKEVEDELQHSFRDDADCIGL